MRAQNCALINSTVSSHFGHRVQVARSAFGSRGFAEVVIQQSAQPLATLNSSSRIHRCYRNDQPVTEALMISFIMIMLHEIADTAPQRVFTKEDHLLMTLFLDRSYESFRVGIRIWAS